MQTYWRQGEDLCDRKKNIPYYTTDLSPRAYLTKEVILYALEIARKVNANESIG